MITVTEHALTALGLRSSSVIAAVQDAREFIERDGKDEAVISGRACGLIGILTGADIKYDDFIADAHVPSRLESMYAMMVAQGMTEYAVKSLGEPFDEIDALVKAKARARRICTAPQHKWMFAEPETTQESFTAVAVAKGVDTKVEVTEAGKIKKGGKQILAAALYKLHVLNAEKPATNQEFIATLVKELGMTKPGATTYAYNMKAQFGTKENPK